jgi:CheY-like chemotaxis protein
MLFMTEPKGLAHPMCAVLIIEDDDEIRASIAEVLSDVGHTYHEAANGREALEWLDKRDSPCIVLLDLQMPVMDGWAFLRAVQAEPRWATISFIVISASIHEAMPDDLVPAKACWSKPFDAEKIANVHLYCAAHRDSWRPTSASVS